jgi:hypothetical protein
MAGTQHPPISNWQPAGGGQPSPAGYGTAPAFPLAPPAKPSGRRRGLIIVGVTAVLIVAVVIVGVVVANSPKGGLSLPARLLGLPKVTSASARHVASELKTAESSGKISGVVAGVYGDPNGAWFAIAGGGICGTCSAKSASVLRHNLTASGYQDATSFPAGVKGGELACGTRTDVIRCTWVDGKTAGDMLFSGGSATSLADAAAKTNQARAATEH